MSEILSCQVIPAQIESPILEQICELIQNSESIRGLMSYWTISHFEFGAQADKLVNCIKGKGYICVDIHQPTNIDCLNELVDLDGQVYLFLKKIKGKTEKSGTLRMSSGLMHSKLIIFDLDTEDHGFAKILIGSHNFTNRAIKGVNIESSLLLEVSKKSKLYAAVNKHVEDTKAKCELMEKNKAPYYKWLQQADDSIEKVIHFSLGDIYDIQKDDSFVLLLSNDSDYKPLRLVGNKVLGCFSSEKESVFFWLKVGQSGEIGKVKTILDINKYAARHAKHEPLFIKHGECNALFQEYKYHAIFTVLEELDPDIIVTDVLEKWESEYSASMIIQESRDLNKAVSYNVLTAAIPRRFDGARSEQSIIHYCESDFISKVALIKS